MRKKSQVPLGLTDTPPAHEDLDENDTVVVQNGLTIYKNWGNRARVVKVDAGKFIAQIAQSGKWKCVDKDGTHLWDYSANTMDWCVVTNKRKAFALVRHFLLTLETSALLK